MLDGSQRNKIKEENKMIKHLRKATLELPKNLLLCFLDQLMLKCWANLVLPFLEHSHSEAERDKKFSIF